MLKRYKKRDILGPAKGPIQGLYDTAKTEEAVYSIDSKESGKKMVVIMHFNKSNSFYLLMQQKYIDSKAKDL